MNKTGFRKHLIFLSALLIWLLPGHYVWSPIWDGWVDPVNLSAGTFLWLLFYGLPWGRDMDKKCDYKAVLMVFAALLSVSVNHFKPLQGLTATYYANPYFQPPAEASFRFRNTNYTRIDPTIDFGSTGFSWTEKSFPLAFANDWRRRTWKPTQLKSDFSYPFSVEWSGWISLPEAGASLRIVATGGKCEFIIDGTAHPLDEKTVRYKGAHTLIVRYSHNSPDPPAIRLDWELENGTAPVPESALSPLNAPIETIHIFNYLSMMGLFLWLFSLLSFMLTVRPRFSFNGRVGLWSVFVSLFLYNAKQIAKDGRQFDALVFQPGNDWLLYETMARDILFGDWLSRIESPLIYMNFAYRYLLAGVHYLAGEMPAQAVWLQQVLMSSLIVFALSATFKRHHLRTAIIFGILIACGRIFSFADSLLDTVFGIALGYLLLESLIRYDRTSNRIFLLLSASSLGLCILVRANFLPFVILSALWLLWSKTDTPLLKRTGAVLIFVGISFAIFALTGLRNYIVSDQWVFLPTNGLTNLWIGNHPPQYDGATYFYAIKPPRDQIIPLIWDYLRNDPLAALHRVSQKLAYLIGIDLRTGMEVKTRVLIPWIVACGGTLFLWTRTLFRKELVLFWAFIVTVNLPLAVIFPWGYGFRLSAPSFLPLYLISAMFIDQMIKTWGENRVPYIIRKTHDRPR